MKILFLCKHNRFRSKVAEAFFKAFDKKDKAKSRGIIKDIDVARSVVSVMKEFGLKLRDKKSKKISKKDIVWADLIVIVADDVKLKLDKKVLVWKISDTSQNDYEGIKKRVKIIKGKVINLISKIRKFNKY